MKKTVHAILSEALKGKADRLAFLKEMMDDDQYKGMMGGELDVPAEMSADEAGLEAMCNMVKAAATEGDWDKVKKIISAFQKLLQEKDETPGEGDSGGDEPAEEGKRMKALSDRLKALEEENKRIKAEGEIAGLIEGAGLSFAKPEARALLVKALLPLSADERKTLIEERKTAQKPEKPVRSAAARGITEGKDGKAQAPTETKALGTWLTSK